MRCDEPDDAGSTPFPPPLSLAIPSLYTGYMTKDRKLAYLAILVNVVIWGAALVIVKPALDVISPYYFLFLRYALASLIMLPTLIFFRPEKITLRLITTIAAIEFVQIGIGHALLYAGLARTSALEASLIATTAPVLVTLGGIIFLKEKEEKNEWIGLALSIAGTLVIILSPFLTNGADTSFSLLGNMLVFGYTVSWMIYMLLAKVHYQGVNKIFVTTISSLVGLITYGIIMAVLGFEPPVSVALSSTDVLRAVLYMGALGTPFAVSLYLYGLNRIEASEATLFSYLQPLIYIPLSVLWLGDQIIPAQLVGLFIVAIGVIIAERRPGFTKSRKS